MNLGRINTHAISYAIYIYISLSRSLVLRSYSTITLFGRQYDCHSVSLYKNKKRKKKRTMVLNLTTCLAPHTYTFTNNSELMKKSFSFFCSLSQISWISTADLAHFLNEMIMEKSQNKNQSKKKPKTKYKKTQKKRM